MIVNAGIDFAIIHKSVIDKDGLYYDDKIVFNSCYCQK